MASTTISYLFAHIESQYEDVISHHDKRDHSDGVQPDDNLTLCNMFWHAGLSCHPYEHGQRRVKLDELWPSGLHVAAWLECVSDEDRWRLTVACCKFVLRCGPLGVLQAIIRQNLIEWNHVFDSGKSLLDIACLASNTEAIAYLLSVESSTKSADKIGHTLHVDPVWFSSTTRKELPARYQASLKMTRRQETSPEDKQLVFRLLEDHESFERIQVMLQQLEFDVNGDRDSTGDLLLHRAIRQGTSHVELILNLVLVHEADLAAVDHRGMTSLCLAADLGYEIIAEVLTCILGADPNEVGTMHRWSPLHFAARKGDPSIIHCLARRGAHVNVEDQFGLRPEDIAQKLGHHDCKELLQIVRRQRCERLSSLAKEGNLTPQMIRSSDLFAVDDDCFTLVMRAAQANRCDNLMVLLHQENCPIDAQHIKCGQTALSLAAMLGKTDAVQTLLRYGAYPAIRDMQGMTPLHHACVNNHVLCAQSIVNARNGLTGLSKVGCLTQDPEVGNIIEEAAARRRRYIVNPTLFECAMNGDADRLYGTLEEGDDVNPLTGTGDWPLYMAVGNKYLSIVQILCENGGETWSRHQTSGSTVLHIACSQGQYDIVSYFLKISRSGQGCSLARNEQQDGSSRQLDVNALNKHGKTALQVAAEKGYSRIVKLLLANGASSALLDSEGQLYKCCEFEGVQVLLEGSRQRHTQQIMSYITCSKNIHYLAKVWKGKFDHNLRDSNGDTPLMFACRYGKVEVVRFFLISAIQSTENDENDFEMSSQNQLFDDSGAFEESMVSRMATDDCTEVETSVNTDSGDPELESDGSYTRRYNVTSTPKGFSSSVSLMGSTAKHSSKLYHSYDSGSQDQANGLSKQSLLRHGLSTTDEAAADSAMGCPGVSDQSLPSSPPVSSPGVYQGTSINHLFAVNAKDGCSAVHRAVQCPHEKHGLAILLLLMAKDPSVMDTAVNSQGMSALHLASKMGRKIIVKKLVNMKCVNLNLRTLNGKLAEDLARTRRIARLLRKARSESQTQTRVPMASSTTEALSLSIPQSNVGVTSVDFDRLEERFKQLQN